jgi:hypothetical protein
MGNYPEEPATFSAAKLQRVIFSKQAQFAFFPTSAATARSMQRKSSMLKKAAFVFGQSGMNCTEK